MHDHFLRFKEVQQITGLSRSTIWRKERAGTFPTRRLISSNAVAWLWSEVAQWLESQQLATDAQGGKHAVR